MIVIPIITAKVDETEVELAQCDAGRDTEHYEVKLTDKHEAHDGKNGGCAFGGYILACLVTSSYEQARAIHDALVTALTVGWRSA